MLSLITWYPFIEKETKNKKQKIIISILGKYANLEKNLAKKHLNYPLNNQIIPK